MTKIKKLTNQPGTRTTYGVYTTAKDGIVYKSKFEAEFVNKFLIPSGMNYEYERNYPGSNCKCDFYIEALDLWVECVYHKFELKYVYKPKNGNRIYLNVPYEEREYVKKYGGRWDPTVKSWYIVYQGQSIVRLHKYIRESEIETTYQSDGKAITKNYDSNMLDKMYKNNGNILVVNYSDLKFNHLLHLIIGKKNDYIFRKIVQLYFELFKEHTKLKKDVSQIKTDV